MQVDERDTVDRLVDGSLVMIGLQGTVDGEVRVVTNNGGVGEMAGAGDGRRDAELLNVVTDDLFPVDAINCFLAHAEEEGRHCSVDEVEVGADENEEAQVVVFVDGALKRD